LFHSNPALLSMSLSLLTRGFCLGRFVGFLPKDFENPKFHRRVFEDHTPLGEFLIILVLPIGMR
jgi:hypothetical protein